MPRTISRRTFVFFSAPSCFVMLVCSLMIIAAPQAGYAQTQDWPQRAVRFILPFGPGSAADTVARVLGDDLAVRWGKPVVVENRPGADGLLAINAVVGARDDHTILVSSTGSFLAHPYMHKKLDYDIDRDLTPIGRIANTLLIVAVPADLPASNLKEFVALARSKPDLNLAASPGVTEFAVDAFLKGENLKTVRVPYKNLGDAARDLSEGRIHFILTSYAVVRPFVESGKVKIIAAGTQNRSPLVKDVPSISESGYPVLAADTSTALFGGPTMPEALRKKIADDMMAALKEPKVRDRVALTGQDIAPSNPDELTQILKGQFQKADGIATSLGMKKAE
jgi:tripartite-type tricarboxylate transporter receptor subunit TctC